MRASFKFQAFIVLVALIFPFSFAFAQEATVNELIEAYGEIATTSEIVTLTSANEQAETSESPKGESAEIDSLVEQISSLLALIAQLQAQLLTLAANPNTPNVGFTKNFSIGDEDIEIQGLQKFLNGDIRTLISRTGPGSRGQESTYFGSLTADAVSRFQELYRSEILTPVGLVRGSGYFGSGTRAKMNALIRLNAENTIVNAPNTPETSPQATEITTNTNTSDTNTLNDQQSLDLSALSGTSQAVESVVTSGNTESSAIGPLSASYIVSDTFVVSRASSYEGAPGESITINGIKLTNSTEIHFNSKTIKGIATSDGKSLTFVIPNIQKGPYFLTFSDGFGKDATRVMDFAITVENATAPEIFSVSPSIGPEGTKITIYGSGITPTGNQIEFGQNVIENLSSIDGKSLTLNVSSGLQVSPGGEWPVFIYISNANGRAVNPGVFVIKN